jgi:hypothetical protein
MDFRVAASPIWGDGRGGANLGKEQKKRLKAQPQWLRFSLHGDDQPLKRGVSLVSGLSLFKKTREKRPYETLTPYITVKRTRCQ